MEERDFKKNASIVDTMKKERKPKQRNEIYLKHWNFIRKQLRKVKKRIRALRILHLLSTKWVIQGKQLSLWTIVNFIMMGTKINTSDWGIISKFKSDRQGNISAGIYWSKILVNKLKTWKQRKKLKAVCSSLLKESKA